MALEENLTIEQLRIGDIIACKYSYMSVSGESFSTRTGFRVKRKNTKSVSLSPLKNIAGRWMEQPIIRIPRIASVLGGKVQSGPPLFFRDNTLFND